MNADKESLTVIGGYGKLLGQILGIDAMRCDAFELMSTCFKRGTYVWLKWWDSGAVGQWGKLQAGAGKHLTLKLIRAGTSCRCLQAAAYLGKYLPRYL